MANKRPETMYPYINEEQKKVYRTLHTGKPTLGPGPYWSGSTSIKPPYPDNIHYLLPNGKWGPEPLPAVQTSASGSKVYKRLSGEGLASETKLTAQWSVANTGDMRGDAYLRLRRGAGGVIATSSTVALRPGSGQKTVSIEWSIPNNLGDGSRVLHLDIMQGNTVIATHPLDLMVVKT